MQCTIDLFADTCSNHGLTTSASNNESLHQAASGDEQTKPFITTNGQKLKAAKPLTHLGSTPFNATHADDEVNLRIVKARVIHGKPRPSVWDRR